MTASAPRTNAASTPARKHDLPDLVFQRRRGLRSAPSRMLHLVPYVAGPPAQEDSMSAFLYRLGRASARHPFRVLGLWLVAAIAVIALQASARGAFNDSERVPGVESQHAADVLHDRFPSQGGQTARIVLHVDDGRLDDARHAATV